MPAYATHRTIARAMASSLPASRRDPRVKAYPLARFAGVSPFTAYPSGHAFAGFGDDLAAGEAAIAAVKKAYASGGLHGFACLNCEKVLRSLRDGNTGRLGSLGLSYQGAASGASTGASVGSVIPGVGTAIGAVVGAIAGALFSKKKDPNAAEKEALKGQLDEYVRVQGSVPGRAFTLTVLKQLIDGAGYRGMWPNIKKWSGDAIAGAIDGCKGCTPPTIRQFVKDQVAAGDIDPISLAGKFTEHVNRTWGSKWFVTSAGATQRQLIIDLMDYFVAENKPDAPLFYAPGWTVAANTPTTAAPAPVPSSTSADPNAPKGSLVQIGYSVTGETVFRDDLNRRYVNREGQWLAYTGALQTTPPAQASPPVMSILPVAPPVNAVPPNAIVTPTPTQPQIDVSALVSQLMQSGANQQQAFLAAMQNLQAQGVSATPQVQQAVADQVKSASSGFGGMPTWALIAIPAALGAVFLIARPRRKH